MNVLISDMAVCFISGVAELSEYSVFVIISISFNDFDVITNFNPFNNTFSWSSVYLTSDLFMTFLVSV